MGFPPESRIRSFYSSLGQRSAEHSGAARPSISLFQLVFIGDPRPSEVNAAPPLLLHLMLSQELLPPGCRTCYATCSDCVSPENSALRDANRAYKEEPIGYITWKIPKNTGALDIWMLPPRREMRPVVAILSLMADYCSFQRSLASRCH